MRRSARKQVDELSTKNIVQHGKLTEHGVNELINYLIKNKLDVFHFHETKFKRI